MAVYSELKTKPFSDIKGINLNYVDNAISLDKDHYSTSDGFEFNLYKAFDNYNDLTINNYSCFILGKKDIFSNWATFNFNKNNIESYITTLKFENTNSPGYLYFASETATINSEYDNISKIVDASFISESTLTRKGITSENLQNYTIYWFNIEIIPNTNTCYIKHEYDSKVYYLFYQPNNSKIAFTNSKKLADELGKFTYILKDNSLNLFFIQPLEVKVQLVESNNVVTDDNGNILPDEFWVDERYNLYKTETSNFIVKKALDPYVYYVRDEYIGKTVSKLSRINIRSLVVHDDSLKLVENRDMQKYAAISSGNNINTTITININAVSIDSNNYLNTSWISYKDFLSGEINLDKSTFDLKSQCLFHFQYNNIDSNYNTTLNLIPLKNHLSNQNRGIRGDYMDDTSYNTPNINFREYTSLETGSNQEFGNSSIILNYTFYDNEYTIKSGEDFSFKINENEDDIRNISLYPFKQLNINDSNFIKNGSFGSTIPFLADKVKKLQLNSKFYNNHQYLCTWLYQSKEYPYGIWLDRYYYPNKISKKKSLSSAVTKESFNNIIDDTYLYPNDIESSFYYSIENLDYFDKRSDLVFESGTQYIYSHTGKQEFNTILEEIEENKQNDFSTFKYGDTFKTIDLTNVKESGILDLNFDMYIDPAKQYGSTLMSTSRTNGFSIINQQDRSPFTYIYKNYFDESNNFEKALVTMLNTNGEEVDTINIGDLISSKEQIQNIFLTEPYDDFIILTDKSILLVSFDLFIKNQYKITDSVIFKNHNERKIDKIIKNGNFLYISVNILDSSNKIIERRFFRFSIEQNKILNEVNRFTTNSRICYKTTDNNKQYPIVCHLYHFLSKTDDNKYIITDKDISGLKAYIRPLDIETGDYIPNNTEVIIESNNYDNKYWFYNSFFKNNEYQGYTYNSADIKNLIISSENILFGVQYDLYSFIQIKDNIIGTRKRNELLYTVEIINLNDYKNSLSDTSYNNILFGSYTPIDAITCTSDGIFACLRYNKNNKENELLIFNNERKLIRTLSLREYGSIMSLDSININGVNYIVFYSISIDEESEEITYKRINISEDLEVSEININNIIDLNLEKTVNYSNIIRNTYDNNINFILKLPITNFISEEFVYSLKLSDTISGWNNFRVIINLNKGIYEVYCNDTLLPISKSFDIENYVYKSRNIFNYPLIIGTDVYKNGEILSNFLKFEDDYYSTNLNLKNIVLYNKHLSFYECQSFELSNKSIAPLTITLPAGQRNNMDEIIRMFKYNPPTNMSNNIRINIKNSNIINKVIQKELANDILNKISQELSMPVNISEINFY